MKSSKLFVGKEVWLKPNPLHRELYGEDYVKTKIRSIGTKNFTIEDDERPNAFYRIVTMKEVTEYSRKAEILLSIDGLDNFDKKEQLIIRVRRYFNSGIVYNCSEEDLNKVIEILHL